MQILAILRRRLEAYGEEEFLPLLEPEAEAIRNLYARGIVRAVWTREDAPGACVMLETESVEKAEEALQEAPLVARGMNEIEKLIPLRGYRGFGPRT